MTQTQIELLLSDLSARIPYGVKCSYYDKCVDEQDEGTITGMQNGTYLVIDGVCIDVENVKPYLLPFSSITDDMMEELNVNGFFKYHDSIANVSHLESNNGISKEIYTCIDVESISFLMDLFHSHHIDYRGWIEMGLAEDATGKNIY